MSNAILSYALWAFLPNIVTGWLQSIYYGITVRAGDPKPQPGTPRYLKHRQRIHITVIIAYLFYTLYEADHWVQQQGDFYQALGVTPNVDERAIKSRFRRLAALYHPDKISTEDPLEHAAAEARFVTLKTAQDTLCNPLRRFAYERFGPDMLKWQDCKTTRDYLVTGLQTTALPLYAGSMIFLALISFTSYLQYGRFWRYLAFVSLFILELHTITRPYPSPIVTKIINPILGTLTNRAPLLPFQFITLARKATFTLFVALSQLGNILPQPLATSSNTSQLDQQQLLRLEAVAKVNEAEAGRLLAMDMAPFAGDEPGTKELSGKVREWLVNNTIRSDPEVRDAMGRAVAKRRTGVPSGAR